MLSQQQTVNDNQIFEQLESNVRSYCRSFPDQFVRSKNDKMYTKDNREFLDFFAGAGALNYGHNNDYLKSEIIAYLENDGVLHGLDMYTEAKAQFLTAFSELILEPRRLSYKIQFCGPTGTNAVEAALKLARKTKKRSGVFSFMGGFHGMSLGSLAVTTNQYNREAAGIDLDGVTFIPYPTSVSFDTIDYMEMLLTDTHSGVAKPAAILLESIQAEGGINIAPVEWLQRLRKLCDHHDILLILDEVQVGCGRTGPFFSFERANIVPDMVVLSKSISGYGLPMALLLLRPDLDIWKPAEHNGTFRGNQLAFVGATAALKYREKFHLEQTVSTKAKWVESFLHKEIVPLDERIEIRGMGLIWGIDLSRFGERRGELAKLVTARCYELGLIIERVGRDDSVIKIMPPLTVTEAALEAGCEILRQALEEMLT